MPPILGHSAALRVLQNAITHDRVHHAWIFHGPPGVGKFTTAIAFAKRLLEGPGLFASAEDEAGFEADAAWTHPDLHVISKELAAVSNFTSLRNRKQTNIPVDLLREHLVGGWIGSGDSKKYIEPPIGKTALSGGGKIFIVDEAELLAREGQNTLLKTLEEPPPKTRLILITAHEDRLLPTIRSRCQLSVAFGPLPQQAVESWLSQPPGERPGNLHASA